MIIKTTKEYELGTLINSLQYDITKLKEELESKYHEGYIDGKAFKDRHLTIRDHFAGLAMQEFIALNTFKMGLTVTMAYDTADLMLAERGKNDH